MTQLSRIILKFRNNIKMIRHGKKLIDKLKIIVYVLLNIYILFQKSLLNFRSILPPLNKLMPLETEIHITHNGLMITLPDIASIRMFQNDYEQWIWNYLKLNEGDVFLDVGAHVGRYTLALAKLVKNRGKVIAIEPHPKNYELLVKNIRKNRFTNIIALNIAAWNKRDEIELFIGNKSGVHSLKHDLQVWHGFSTKRSSVTVLAKPLDEILMEIGLRPNWIKIDVEGAEIEVIKGLEKTLKNNHPKIMIESWAPNKEKLIKLLKNFGYNVIKTPSPTNFFASINSKRGN